MPDIETDLGPTMLDDDIQVPLDTVDVEPERDAVVTITVQVGQEIKKFQAVGTSATVAVERTARGLLEASTYEAEEWLRNRRIARTS